MKRKSRIMLVTRSAVIGGIEEHVFGLAKYLVEQGHPVIWLVLSKAGLNNNYRTIPGVRMITLGDKAGQSFSSFLLLGTLGLIVWRFKPKIVHLHGIRPIFLFSIIPFPFTSRRISTIHGSPLLMARNSTGKVSPLKKHISVIMHFVGVFQSLKVFTISKSLQNQISSIVLPLMRKKIKLIYNGVVLGQPHDGKSLLPDSIKYSFRENEMQIVFVGRLDPNKGLDVLLRAISLLEPCRLRCHVFGNGYYKKSLKALCNKLELDRVVHFWGEYPNVRDFIKEFDVLVLPSLEEGMGLAVLEAMAAGVPVIGSRTGGIPEAVLDNETGYTFEPGDVRALSEFLIKSINNPESLKDMGTKGRERAYTQFNRDLQLKRIYSEYNISEI